MKSTMLIVPVLLLFEGTAFAADVYDILRKLPVQRPDSGTQTLNSRVYAATVRMNLRDGDANNSNFSDNDVMDQLILASTGGRLEFPMGNKSVIDQFARDNAREILRILFPDGFAANTMGQSESQLSSSLTFDEVVAPFKGPRSEQQKRFSNELSGRVEYNDIELNRRNGYSIGGLLSYERLSDSGLEVGVLVPYRFTSLNDSTDTKAHFAQFDFYGKYTLYDDKQTKVKVGGDVFTSVLISRSDALSTFGNVTYGGGVFLAYERNFQYFTATLGTGLKVSKTSTEFSRNKSDLLSDIINAINDKEVDTDLTYGFSITVPREGKLKLNLGAHRTNSFASDISDKRDSQTKVRVVGTYEIAENIEFNAGYSTVLEIDNFTGHIFFLNMLSRF